MKWLWRFLKVPHELDREDPEFESGEKCFWDFANLCPAFKEFKLEVTKYYGAFEHKDYGAGYNHAYEFTYTIVASESVDLASKLAGKTTIENLCTAVEFYLNTKCVCKIYTKIKWLD